MAANETQISRVTRSKEEARASYDKMSRWYDALAGGSEKRLIDAGLQRLAAQTGERVLEIGFGTGHAIVALARSVGESGQVYGIDISEGMLNVTQEKVRQAGLTGRVKLKCGDAVQLPFEADLLDAVFMSFALELFDTPEIPAVLHECKRVLRNGGRVCVVAMSKKGEAGLMSKLYEWGHTKLPRYVDCRPIFAQHALQQVGLEIVKADQMSMWGLPVEIVVAKKT